MEISMEHFQKCKIKAGWGTAEMAGWVKYLSCNQDDLSFNAKNLCKPGLCNTSGLPVHLWRDEVRKQEIPGSSWASEPCVHSGKQHRNLVSNNVKGEDWQILPSEFYMFAMTWTHLHSWTCTPMHTDLTFIHICIHEFTCKLLKIKNRNIMWSRHLDHWLYCIYYWRL